MKVKGRRNLGIIVVLFIVASAISWILYFKEYRQNDTVDITKFPRTIAGWTSEDMPLKEEEYAILETRNVVARRYTAPQPLDSSNKKPEVYLLLVYSQNNRKVSHPPEICYTGGGISILESQKDFLTVPLRGETITIAANRLLLELRGARQYSFYWFKVGNAFSSNYWQQQILIAVKTFLGQPHSNALIRLSSDLQVGHEDQSIKAVQEFAKVALPDILQYLP